MIHSKAMLVSLRISTWTARRYDRAATKQINALHSATADAGRYNKSLLPGDCPTYQAVLRAATAARDDHYKHTLPWSDEGKRLLPTAEYNRYADVQRAHGVTFDHNLAQFIADYPQLRTIAQTRLNGLWRAADYPDVVTLRSKFARMLEFSPLPAAGDFRLGLPADQLADLEKASADRVESAVRDAMADAWRRLHDVVNNACERLQAPDAIFRDSLIGNIRETCDLLRTLNVANDPSLDATRAEVERQLATYDAQALRDSPARRADVASKAQSILDNMSAYMGNGAACLD